MQLFRTASRPAADVRAPAMDVSDRPRQLMFAKGRAFRWGYMYSKKLFVGLFVTFAVATSQLAYADCSVVRLERGGSGGIWVKNESRAPIYVYKVDSGGDRSLLRVVKPGVDFDTSYLTIPVAWLIATSDNRCIGAYQLNQRSFFVVVTQSLVDQAGGLPSIAAQSAPTDVAPLSNAAGQAATQLQETEREFSEKETPSQRHERRCEYLAGECYKRAERDYKWYMRFFDRDRNQLDPRDYRAEQSRASRERRESVERCLATRNECLGERSGDD